VTLAQGSRTPARFIKLLGALLIAALAWATYSASAQAQACPSAGAQAVFNPWGDPRYYVLAPDGGFESGASGWSLAGKAAAVDGNESYYLHGPGDRKSLSLPAGSSTGSPPICMAIDTPVFRFMARNGGDPSSRLRVEARYSLLGLLRTNVIANLTAGPEWAPSQPISTVLGLSTLVGTLVPSAIEIRFTPLDAQGKWQVDDLYIDPFRRG
jgi:hypothetical protein